MRGKGKGRGSHKMADTTQYQSLSPKALDQKIRELEAKMYTYAQNLEFEQAAELRDQVHQLRQQFIAIS